MARRGPELRRNLECVFEVNPEGDGPRWMLNVDKGSTDTWADGIITEITDTYIQIDALFPNGDVRPVTFPNHGSTDYQHEQWWYPGYLQSKERYNDPDCDCGYGNNSPFHWNFCRRGSWLRDNE